MYNHKKINYPHQLVKDMNVEETIFPTIESDTGIVTLSQQVNANHILRIYQLLLNSEDDSYDIVQELAAFTFNNREKLTSFINELPQLNGIEMLLLLNPLYRKPQIVS